MTFDVSQPTDTTKIRNLGVVIRPNWQAIEDGDSSFLPQSINLANRTPLAAPNDPVAIADSFINYCKEDGAGNPEFYGIDAASNILQYSEGGFIGGPTQDFKMNNFRFGTSTVDYSRNNVATAWIKWTESGSVLTTVSSFRMSVARLSEGVYRFTLSDTRSNANYIPIGNANIGGNARIFKFGTQTTTTFVVNIQNGDGTLRDSGGFVVVFGGF
jgi:hypothetical protein